MPEKELLFLKLFTSTCFFCLFSLSEQELCVKVLPDNNHFKKLFIYLHTFPSCWVWKRNGGAGEDSWMARRSKQSILKEANPEYSLGGLML